MNRCAIGLDFGTSSCRALLVDLDAPAELAQEVYAYPTGDDGVIGDPVDPHLARQHPRDYLAGLEHVLRGVLRRAQETAPWFDPAQAVAIGVATTGSTPMPVDREGTPLALLPELAHEPAAMAWLWKDHTAHEEAAAITATARRMRPQYLAACGGVYSAEWFWSKLWRCRRGAPRVFDAARSWVELCDWIPALLCGRQRPEALVRSVCAAGHKAMYRSAWGGLPDGHFLAALDPALAGLRSRLFERAHDSSGAAGVLCDAWARRTGLRAGIPVAVGAFDAHVGAVGAGVKEATLVKIVGTSTCDITVARAAVEIPGVCGIVEGSVLPGAWGIEAGQNAVGDMFQWFVDAFVPERYGRGREEKFVALERAAARLAPGEHGLLALDWANGNRTILVDNRLTGLVVGQTLATRAHEVYRALVESTAFGARRIVDRLAEHGVRIEEVVACGGLSWKSPLVMQTYADVLGVPIKVAASHETCALGAALFGAVAAGASGSVPQAQARLCRFAERVYRPAPEAGRVYGVLYALFCDLHDAFGTAGWQGNLAHVMKRLLALRTEGVPC